MYPWLTRWPVLVLVWKFFKALLRVVTGKCELQRLCEEDKKTSSSTVSGSLVVAVEESLRWSQQLANERRDLLAIGDGTKDNSQQIYRRICSKKRLDASDTLLQTKLLPSLQKMVELRVVLDALDNSRKSTYDVTNFAHEAELMTLWQLLKPSEPLENRVTKQWQDIGFQGNDPSTDFRGMGFLGLRALVYFARSYPTLAQSALLASQHPTRWFPFAITGIQIAQRVLVWSESGRINKLWYNASPITDSIYFELFSFAFSNFDKTWRASTATILEFPSLFEKYEAKLLAELQELDQLTVN